jgi:beta-glucanase (GH16 family)
MAPKATAPAVSGNNAPAKAASTSSIVFEDHFKGPEIDKNTWLVEKAAGRGQNTPRADLQFYLPEALRINQGLRIVAESASIDDPVTGVHFNYSSGRIRSKKTFLYGRFEFRAKLPRGRGLWPGLWMRTPPPEAMNGEIDVIEGYGSHPNIVRSTLHPWVNGKESKSYSCLLYVRSKPDSPSFASAKKVRINLPRDLASDYHSYAVEWRADYITWFLDGAPYFTVREEIPKLPMAIMIEMAIASHWDGVPDKSLVLPQTFEISDVVVRE